MIEEAEDHHRTTNFQLSTKTEPVSASFHHHHYHYRHIQRLDLQTSCAQVCWRRKQGSSRVTCEDSLVDQQFGDALAATASVHIKSTTQLRIFTTLNQPEPLIRCASVYVSSKTFAD